MSLGYRLLDEKNALCVAGSICLLLIIFSLLPLFLSKLNINEETKFLKHHKQKKKKKLIFVSLGYFEEGLPRESVIFDIFWSRVLTVVISKLLYGFLGGCERILILFLSSYANKLFPFINRKARQERSVLYWILVLRALYCVSVEHLLNDSAAVLQ